MDQFNQSRDLAIYIDRLRIYRNISQDDFLVDIVSSRQYRRYLSGDSTMTYIVLDKLSRRLGFNAEFIIMEVESAKIKLANEVHNLYNAIVYKNKDKANEILKKISGNPTYLQHNQLLYDHCKNMYEYQFNGLSQKQLIDKTKKLVDYDMLLKKKVLSTSELLIMVNFFSFEEFTAIDDIAKKLESYLEKDLMVVSGQNIKVIILVFEELSRYYSIKEDYQKMYDYAVQGIKYANEVKSYYLLDSLHFFAGAASFDLNEIERSKKHLIKSYSILLSEGKFDKMKSYKAFYKEVFGFDIAEEINRVI